MPWVFSGISFRVFHLVDAEKAQCLSHSFQISSTTEFCDIADAQRAPKDTPHQLSKQTHFGITPALLSTAKAICVSDSYIFFFNQHFFSGERKTIPVSALSITLFEMVMLPHESSVWKISFSEHSESLYWSEYQA